VTVRRGAERSEAADAARANWAKTMPLICSDQTLPGRTDELVPVPCNTTCLVGYSVNAFIKGFYGVDFPICQSLGCATVDDNGDIVVDSADRLGIAALGEITTYICDDETFETNPDSLQATPASGNPCNWFNPGSMEGDVLRADQVCTGLVQIGLPEDAGGSWALANIRLVIGLVILGVALLVGACFFAFYRHQHRQGKRVRDSIELTQGTTCSQFVGLMLLAFSTILLLVFMNAMQPFLLSDIYFVDSGDLGKTTGTLALADEIWSLVWLGGWGLVCDKFGLKVVILSGLAMVSLSLVLLPNVGSVFPGVLVARLLFAQGGAALSGMMTVVLAAVIGASSLGPGAGMLGLASGFGALFSVFVLVGQVAPALCVQYTYYITAALPALLFGLYAAPGLNFLPQVVRDESEPHVSMIRLVRQGARAVWERRRLQAACVSGYCARAGSVVVSSFISLWIVRFLQDSGGECGASLANDASTCGEDLVNPNKRSCAEGFTIASRVSGMAQVFSLVFAVVSGYIASRTRDPLKGLAAFALFGVLAYGVSPAVSDPSAYSVYGVALMWGIAEISMIIFAQVAVAKELGELHGIQGAVAGAYSMAGSLGIITITYVGGWLFDVWIPQAPFVLMAIASGITAMVAICVMIVDPLPAPAEEEILKPERLSVDADGAKEVESEL